MKIAVGIIALVFSMIALMQSCTINGLGRLTEDKAIGDAGALGILTAIIIFFAGAFSFGLPKVARFLFVLGFLASIPARQSFPDMWIWGVASLVLGLLLFFDGRKNSKDAKQ